MRVTRPFFAGAALAVLAGLALAGCTASPASTTSASAAGSAPSLTVAQARQVFDSYVATADRAAAAGDGALALSDTTGVQATMLSTSYQAAK